MTLAWFDTTTPFGSNQILGAAWSPTLGLWVAVGFKFGSIQAISSPDGVNWSFTGAGVLEAPTCSGLTDVCWSPSLGLFLAVGTSSTGNTWTSPDGITWTPQGFALDPPMSARSCAWSEDLGLFVVGGNGGFAEVTSGPAHTVATSPDGSTWTIQTTPWDSADVAVRFAGAAYRTCWASGPGLFVVCGNSGDIHVPALMVSADGAVWTSITSPIDTTTYPNQQSAWVGWFAAAGEIVAGYFAFGTPYNALTSPDGSAWTATTLAVDGIDEIITVADVGPLFLTVSISSPGNPGAQLDSALVRTAMPRWGNYSYSPDLDAVVALANGGSCITCPVPTTGAATPSGSDVTLDGSLIPNTPGGGPVNWFFEYGPTMSYGSTSTGGTEGGLSSVPVTDTLTGLAPGFYHYRLVAVHGAVTEYGADATFTITLVVGPTYQRVYGLEIQLTDDGVEAPVTVRTSAQSQQA